MAKQAAHHATKSAPATGNPQGGSVASHRSNQRHASTTTKHHNNQASGKKSTAEGVNKITTGTTQSTADTAAPSLKSAGKRNIDGHSKAKKVRAGEQEEDDNVSTTLPTQTQLLTPNESDDVKDHHVKKSQHNQPGTTADTIKVDHTTANENNNNLLNSKKGSKHHNIDNIHHQKKTKVAPEVIITTTVPILVNTFNDNSPSDAKHKRLKHKKSSENEENMNGTQGQGHIPKECSRLYERLQQCLLGSEPDDLACKKQQTKFGQCVNQHTVHTFESKSDVDELVHNAESSSSRNKKRTVDVGV